MKKSNARCGIFFTMLQLENTRLFEKLQANEIVPGGRSGYALPRGVVHHPRLPQITNGILLSLRILFAVAFLIVWSKDHMISIDKIKEIAPELSHLSDQEIEEVRATLYDMGKLAFDSWWSEKRTSRIFYGSFNVTHPTIVLRLWKPQEKQLA